MNETAIIVVVGVVATVLGTLGGAFEAACKPGSAWYRFGVLLASLGVDLTSLSKLGSGK
jgi:hypothetical protein